MNRRKFIKKAFGTAIALAVPTALVAKSGTTATVTRAFGNHYTLGKGTIYLDGIPISNTLNFTITESDLIPKCVQIHNSITITSTIEMHEFNRENLELALAGDTDETT